MGEPVGSKADKPVSNLKDGEPVGSKADGEPVGSRADSLEARPSEPSPNTKDKESTGA